MGGGGAFSHALSRSHPPAPACPLLLYGQASWVAFFTMVFGSTVISAPPPVKGGRGSLP